MAVETDYSKYANIANSTKTVEINGEKVRIRGQEDNKESWSSLSEFHKQINEGDTFFCTDGKDDGEITNTEKAGLFVNGMWNSTKDKAVPTLVAAGTAVGIKAVGATALGSAIAGTTVGAAVIAAAPVVLGVAAVVGGVALAIKGISSIVKSSQEAKNATTDAEAKQAWGQMGYSTTDAAVGTATAVIGAKSLKKTVPKARANKDLANLENKTKGLGNKIKNFFGKIFKKGKTTTNANTGTNTSTNTSTNASTNGEILKLEAPKIQTEANINTNSTTNTPEIVHEVEVLPKPKQTFSGTNSPKQLEIIDAEVISNAEPTNQGYKLLNAGNNAIQLGESVGHNFIYDGNIHLDSEGYEYAYTLFNI